MSVNGDGRANYIREWRMFRGLETQGDLAKRCGTTRATISRLESGKLPYTQRQLERIAKALNCTPADLIGQDPNRLGSIFQIYEMIPAKERDTALAVLIEHAKKSARPKKVHR